jgi:phosphatidylglycerophosphate synthase
LKQLSDERSSGFFRRVEAMRLRHTRPGALYWSYAVNYRIGALFAVILMPARVSPSLVTVAGTILHAAGALYVLWIQSSASVVDVVVLVLIWQVAYSLDCADGLLARARNESSPFGAWLDQIADFIGHAFLFTALVVFISRALSISAPSSAALAGFVIAGSLLQLFASSQRNSIIGTTPAMATTPSTWLRVASLGQHLADYGAWLFAASILVLFPRALLIFLLLAATVAVATVLGQVAVNWRAQLRRN